MEPISKGKDNQEMLGGVGEKGKVQPYLTTTAPQVPCLFLHFSRSQSSPQAARAFIHHRQKTSPPKFFTSAPLGGNGGSFVLRKGGKLLPTFSKGPFWEPAEICPNSSLLLQGMAVKHSIAALHTNQHKVFAKLHPFLRTKMWGFGCGFGFFFFVGGSL